MATEYVPPSQIDRDPGNVNPAEDPGIYVPPGLPNPSIYGPGRLPAPAGTVEPIVPVVGPSIEGNGPTNVIPNLPAYITVQEDGNIVLIRATALNFTGGVSITSVDSQAVINISGGGGDLGNWAFNANQFYNLNGGVIDNGDLSHGATSQLTIPPNGSGNAMSLLNYYGNIVLTPSLNPGNTYSWTFDNSGNLVMPTNSASINYANGTPYAGGAGTQGATGSQGTTGTGTQGATGTGTQGTTGAQGTIGVQGPSDGAQGTQGVQGTIGVQGPSDGVQGIQGIQGAVGTQGIGGTQGVQGTGGSTGKIGRAHV